MDRPDCLDDALPHGVIKLSTLFKAEEELLKDHDIFAPIEFLFVHGIDECKVLSAYEGADLRLEVISKLLMHLVVSEEEDP